MLRLVIIIMVYTFTTCNCYAQSLNLKEATSPGSIILKYNNNFEKFPLSIGFEGMFVFESKNKPAPGVLGYIDVNLYNKTFFLKLEYGKIFDDNLYEEGSNYGSIGLNYNIFKINKNNKIYFHGGVFITGNKSGGGLFGFTSIRYLYAINKFVGLVSSVRYPFGRFNIIAITFGIQFITQ